MEEVMTKTTKELIDESSTLSSSRWSLVTCIRWAIALSILSILSVIVCYIIGKPLPDGFLGGCAIIIGLIVGIPTAGKATQSFSEYGHNYFDKFNKEEIKADKPTTPKLNFTEVDFNDDDGK